MLQQKDFVARDFEICKKCIEEDALTPEAAEKLNRLSCMLYKGYFKIVVEKGIREEDVDERVEQFVKDLDWIVMNPGQRSERLQGIRKMNTAGTSWGDVPACFIITIFHGIHLPGL